jgi:hypothetical protein
MKVVYFNTHATLGEKHAKLCLSSLANQTIDYLWDALYIYNSHSYELSNSKIFNIIKELDLDKNFKKIELVPYNDDNLKTNFQDFQNLISHCKSSCSQNKDSFLLYLKSDYVLNTGFFEALDAFNDCENFIFSAPIYNTKEWLTKDDIIKKSYQTHFTCFDSETYYNGSDYQDDHPLDGGPPTNNTIATFELTTHWNNASDWFGNCGFKGMKRGPANCISPNDPAIKFVSHSIRGDVNVHFMPIKTFCNISFARSKHDSWAYWQGWNQHIVNGGKMLNTNKAFGIHVFHEITSINRKEDRNDPEKNRTDGQRF